MVDVVVRVDRPAEPLAGEAGEHLVHVHVAARARAGLEHVDRELGVVLAVGHLFGRGRDRVGEIWSWVHAERRLTDATAALMRASASICAALERSPEIGKFSTARWVCGSPPRVGGHAHLSHRVALDALLAHRLKSGTSASVNRRIGGMR